jgi:hypothetical protein
MIIHKPVQNTINGEIVISSKVDFQKLRGDLPEKLWFRFPSSYSNYISEKSDGFLVCLCLVASYFQENVDVRGSISPKLASNIDRFLQPYYKAYPSTYHRVVLNYEKLEDHSNQYLPDATVTAFSGGIDSSFTIWSHFFPSEAPEPVMLTHGLFINGMDIYKADDDSFDLLYEEYLSIFTKMDLGLFKCNTNAYDFYKLRQNWAIAHTPNIVGTALIMGNKIKTFIKPGGNEIAEGGILYPGYLVDQLSTETMEIKLHSPDIGRKQKLLYIKNWETVHHHLRVCIDYFKNPNIPVCYRCEKCLNTILAMEIQGIRKNFQHFNEPLHLERFLPLVWIGQGFAPYRKNLTTLFLREKRYDLYILYWLILIPHAAKEFFQYKIFHPFPKKIKYLIKKLVYYSR